MFRSVPFSRRFWVSAVPAGINRSPPPSPDAAAQTGINTAGVFDFLDASALFIYTARRFLILLRAGAVAHTVIWAKSIKPEPDNNGYIAITQHRFAARRNNPKSSSDKLKDGRFPPIGSLRSNPRHDSSADSDADASRRPRYRSPRSHAGPRARSPRQGGAPSRPARGNV